MKMITFADAGAMRGMAEALDQMQQAPQPRRRFWQSGRRDALRQRMAHWSRQLSSTAPRAKFPHTLTVWTRDDEEVLSTALANQRSLASRVTIETA